MGGEPRPAGAGLVPADLLTARQVQLMLAVDRATIYRMAQDGRLPAVKVGRQWRFPAGHVRHLLGGPPPVRPQAPALPVPEPIRSPERARLPVTAVEAVARAAGALLGVMVVVTDMTGRPLSQIVNPCPWFAARAQDPQALAECVEEWRTFADDIDLVPHFRLNGHGFECARALIRSGSDLIGMVLAGGIAPAAGTDPAGGPAGVDRLDDAQRQHVLQGLSRVGAVLSDLTGGPGHD